MALAIRLNQTGESGVLKLEQVDKAAPGAKDDGRDELCGRAFRSGLSFPAGRGEQQTVFSMDQRLVEFE